MSVDISTLTAAELEQLESDVKTRIRDLTGPATINVSDMAAVDLSCSVAGGVVSIGDHDFDDVSALADLAQFVKEAICYLRCQDS